MVKHINQAHKDFSGVVVSGIDSKKMAHYLTDQKEIKRSVASIMNLFEKKEKKATRR